MLVLVAILQQLQHARAVAQMVHLLSSHYVGSFEARIQRHVFGMLLAESRH